MIGLKAAHLTSVHPPFDPRIFYKEARSLAVAGYEVTLIVPHHHDEKREGVQVRAVPRPRSRVERMLVTPWKVWRVALAEHADIYHFHDPELIPVGLVLKLLRKRVVYDAHEALAEKILSKDWILRWLRPLVSRSFALFERLAARFFDHVVTADSIVAGNFSRAKVTVLPNYPLLQFVKNDQHKRDRPGDDLSSQTTVLVYAGHLTRDRGLHVMLEAMALLQTYNVELHLLGKFENQQDEVLIKSLRYVKYHGFLPLNQMYEHLARAHIGLVLLQPVPAYLYAGENTTKLFDYMACGLPVITSDFSNLSRIVTDNCCGLCVNSRRAEEAAAAVSSLIDNPRIRNTYGQNGRNAVLRSFNWEQQGQVLRHLYGRILSGER